MDDHPSGSAAKAPRKGEGDPSCRPRGGLQGEGPVCQQCKSHSLWDVQHRQHTHDGPSWAPILPKDLLVTILKLVDEAPWPRGRGGAPVNPLLPLRLVSRSFRDGVDVVVKEFTCQIKCNNTRDGRLLARVGHCLQRVLPRWTNLKDLTMSFDFKPDHLQFALATFSISCPGLQSMSLTATVSTPGEPEPMPGLEVLSSLQNLTSLSLSNFYAYSNWAQGLSSLPSLEILKLMRSGVRELEPLTALISLRIDESQPSRKVRHRVKLPNLHLSPRLQFLRLNCLLVRSLSLPPSLEDLQVSNADVKRGFEPNNPLPELRSLFLHDLMPPEGPSLPSLASSQHMKTLSLSHLTGMTVLPSLSPLSALENVTILGLTSIQHLPHLTGLSQLRRLQISECHLLEALPAVGSLRSLTSLSLSNMSSLATIPELDLLSSLQSLELQGCPVLAVEEEILFLTNLTCLQTVCVNQTQPMPSFKTLVNLRRLTLGERQGRVHLDGMGALTSLHSLSMFKLSLIQDIGDLCLLTSLRELSISLCPQVTTLALEALVHLQKVCLNGVRLTIR